MKWVNFALAMALSIASNAQDVIVVQINAKWNKANTLEELRDLENCKYVFGWLENQPYEIQSNVTSVPIVVVYKEDVPKMQYVAGVSLKLDVTVDEIQRLVNSVAIKE